MSEKDGGPAYPVEITERVPAPEFGEGMYDKRTVRYPGLSIRQYYKAQALAGLLATGSAEGAKYMVNVASAHADLMLAEDAEHAKTAK